MDDKKLAVVTPFLLLTILVAFTQTQIVPYWIVNHKSSLESPLPAAGGLQLLGYNFNRDLAQVSVTLWDKGSGTIAVTAVYFDNVKLIEGVVGAPTDLMIPSYPATQGNSSLTSNDITFPVNAHWNMLTEGSTLPVMQPNDILTLYLGVSATVAGSTHTLMVVAGTQAFEFQLQS